MSQTEEDYSTVYTYGINDGVGLTRTIIEGRRVYSPYYITWVDMLKRCYSKEHHIKYPKCKDYFVCEDWLRLSNFKMWMENQDWKGKELDKDILYAGNKMYSPKTCRFVPKRVNTFVLEGVYVQNERLPIGVTMRPSGSYRARITINGKRKHLGDYRTPEAAHEAWRKAKLEQAVNLSIEEDLDYDISMALIKRYSDYGHWKN